jgi:outer membrane protein assembly factor BamA
MRFPTLCLILLAASTVSAQERRRVEFSGIPALNFDADEGMGYGAIVQFYGYDGNPNVYRWTLQPTVFFTTEGRRDYTVFFDAPSRSDHPWRLTAFAGREQQLSTPYYGLGNQSVHSERLEGGANHYYYRYGRDRLRAAADIQHAAFRPEIRFLVGAGASSEKIDLTPFDSGTTLLETQFGQRSLATGRTNFVRAGLTYDTRDREIGTHAGTWADVLVQRVDKSLGATNSYTRVTATYRHYAPLGDRLTFANRLLLQNISGDAPFYALSDVQTTQKSQDGLGGSSTVRGLPKNRYAGTGMFVSNNELRWRALDFTRGGRQSSLVFSAFYDTGRVWSDQVEFSSLLKDLHAGYGGGARLALGPSFVIAVDVGHSSQSTAPIYIGLGYMF